jgi:hypothetical protein
METKNYISEEIDPAAVITASKKWLERAPRIRSGYLEAQAELSCHESDFGLQALQGL